jgi:hypothetical protein
MNRGQETPSRPSREQYVSELTEKLGEWDQKVNQITNKANRGQMDSVLLDDLLQKQAAAHGWLNEVKEADDAMWEELKAQSSVASQDFQDVLERASERFKVPGPRTAMHESQRQEGGSGPPDTSAQEATGEERTSRQKPRTAEGTEASDSG